ncbi:toll/interleukin-1 receptor domain-containing protein [Dictyobacter formicarum]|uniref:TIR domain-containing protein n=1 Tax=Dictyobacter formicarum TaxID=2778368 RepID=A0ABQ3VGJ3_9CHLR|nr:toll/interleukin-1 receptor domain-containing protein [Dictyobacter formicarum]GHO84900.1 hypothetical protein KSZ_29060 [Dictyobacter formicarum]
MTAEAMNSINIFYCYASEDKDLQNELNKHLRPLIRQYRLKIREGSDISPGAEWEKEIQAMIDTAHVILLLVSPDSISSAYIYEREIPRAIERHKAGDAYVIPVILRPVDWQEAMFSNLPVLPKDARPVITWPNRDEAFLDIAKGIRKVIDKIKAKQARSLLAIEDQVPPPSVRERILQILYEKRSDPTFDGEDLAHLIGKQWHEIQSDVADLEDKGYIVTRQSQIMTRIFHRPRITAAGVHFFESGMYPFL